MAFHEVPLQYIHMNKDFEKIKNELSLGAINILRHKEYQLDPLGAAFAASLRGIKHFQDFKKASHPL